MPELEDRDTESNDAENLRPVSEVEEDEWVTFLSDPPSDMDMEKEPERVAEANKSKDTGLNEGKPRNESKIQKPQLTHISRGETNVPLYEVRCQEAV